MTELYLIARSTRLATHTHTIYFELETISFIPAKYTFIPRIDEKEMRVFADRLKCHRVAIQPPSATNWRRKLFAIAIYCEVPRKLHTHKCSALFQQKYVRTTKQVYTSNECKYENTVSAQKGDDTICSHVFNCQWEHRIGLLFVSQWMGAIGHVFFFFRSTAAGARCSSSQSEKSYLSRRLQWDLNKIKTNYGTNLSFTSLFGVGSLPTISCVSVCYV